MDTPCRSCGACCSLPVSFHQDDLDTNGGCVPHSLTVARGYGHVRMLQTAGPVPWCLAFRGVPGKHTKCDIYEKRPSVCRDFEPSSDLKRNEWCDDARSRFGLSPLAT